MPNPTCQLPCLSSIYERHEQEKMKKYSSRVITVERASFTPLVYTTFGEWGPQAQRYHKRLASLIATKRNEDYHYVINHIRLKVRFNLLRSVLVAVRGNREERIPNPNLLVTLRLIWCLMPCSMNVIENHMLSSMGMRNSVFTGLILSNKYNQCFY